jgi:hypothetical protein
VGKSGTVNGILNSGACVERFTGADAFISFYVRRLIDSKGEEANTTMEIY